MWSYKSFLKGLLTINIMFVIFAAGVGYRMSDGQYPVFSFSGAGEQAAARVPESGKLMAASGEVDRRVIPAGQTVGLYINTEGILVIDTCEVKDMDGNSVYPARYKLLSGDYILKLNGEDMKSKKQLVSRITECDGTMLVFTVRRSDVLTEVKIAPVQTAVDEYKVGIWVRDDLQGLGTVTYVDGNRFGALGHSITDCDTGVLMDVSGGSIYHADIFGVDKGTSGTPGEIKGMISYQTENIVGTISDNRIYGVYGEITEDYRREIADTEPVGLGTFDEVKMGRAYIQSYVSGEKKLYEIEITDTHKNENGDREMEITVTDKELIALTGGIVQGMSGSPILQNGKLIGAVTHVFVEDPTRGYGIFIEEMME